MWGLRGEYHSADIPAIRSGHSARQTPAAVEHADDRRPVVAGEDRLGVVFRRLVEREWRCGRDRLDQRNGPTCADPNTIAGATFPNCPDNLFQFHHQAFNYYAAYAPGTPARAAHLRDEQDFIKLAQTSSRECMLKPVSLIKPIGAENEHPGYTNETSGSDHLVDLISAIENSACAKDTMIIITYDEFGGQWDHVTPPGQGGAGGRTINGARARGYRRFSSRHSFMATSLWTPLSTIRRPSWPRSSGATISLPSDIAMEQ